MDAFEKVCSWLLEREAASAVYLEKNGQHDGGVYKLASVADNADGNGEDGIQELQCHERHQGFEALRVEFLCRGPGVERRGRTGRGGDRR